MRCSHRRLGREGPAVHLVDWTEEEVEKELKTRPGYSLGYVTNPGGVKSSEITQCLALFYEDDNKETTWEEKAKQWEVAGLLRPSYQVWTGGKSVHNYWMLEEPCNCPSRSRQRRSASLGISKSRKN